MRFVDRAKDSLFWVLPHVKEKGSSIVRKDGIERFIFAWNPSYAQKTMALVKGIDIA